MTTTASTITPREREVLRLMCEGLESKAIATRLRIAERTVEIHRRNLRKRTGCRTACQLGVWAVRNGVVCVTTNTTRVATAVGPLLFT